MCALQCRLKIITFKLHCTYIGPKFWRSTRKVKAIRSDDYLEFRGKKKRSPIFDFSDSDSDFELPPVKKSLLSSSSKTKTKECIDLTAQGEDRVSKSNDAQGPVEINKLKDVTTRIEKIEASLSKSLEKHEELERVRRIVSCLEEEKQALQRSIEDIKIHLSCIICKTVAKFPWLMTQCCTVLMCKDCGEQWLRMESSCPHCRAIVELDDCITVTEIRAIQEIISSLSPED